MWRIGIHKCSREEKIEFPQMRRRRRRERKEEEWNKREPEKEEIML